MRVLAAFAAALVITACTGSSGIGCEQAAIGQALAEQRWQEELEEHVLADEALLHSPGSDDALDDHDHSAEALFGARVDMILADAETRRECG